MEKSGTYEPKTLLMKVSVGRKVALVRFVARE